MIELDSPWLLAAPVRYSSDLPLTYTAEGMADLLFMKDKDAISYLVSNIVFIKTPDWSTEQEWRISSFKRGNETELFSDYTFSQYELKKIITGPYFDNSKRDILKNLSKSYPNASLVSSRITELRTIELII